MIHRTAGPSHYDWEAPIYDAFNEAASRAINRTIERLLRERGARTVLDFACGTGSQVYWLSRRGFDVVGRDISPAMLRYARKKGSARLARGDMRSTRVGRFDAVLTISNAVGHLTRRDFAAAMRNIRAQLNPGGAYVFDIFNRGVVARDVAALTIDWKIAGHRLVQHSTIDRRGVLTSHTACHARGRMTKNTSTLQLYGVRELASMLRSNGFARARFTAVDGSAFHPRTTLQLLAVAHP